MKWNRISGTETQSGGAECPDVKCRMIVPTFKMNFRSGFARLALLLLLGAPPLFGQTITNFNPKFGTNGDQITITGTGFVPGIKVFFWNGVQVPAGNIFVNTANQLTVLIVPNGISTGPISVQIGSGSVSQSAQPFTVVGPAPYITDFSPVAGSRNEPNILINGVHFQNATFVRFSGVIAGFAATSDGLQINTTVPATAAIGTNFISVTNPSGTHSNTTPFFVYGPGPFVTNFSPYFGSAPQTVTIRGGHFLPATGKATNVTFNGRLGTSFHVSTDDQLEVNVPNGATTGPLVILSGLGSSFNFTTTSNFFVPPVITAFSPFSGRAGTNLLISGTNFTGATSVTFHGTNGPSTLVVSLPPGNVTSNSIQVTVPGGVTNGPIRVDTPGGQFTTSSNFLVLPSIYGFAPDHGRSQTNVVVTGANFNVSGLVVKFGGVNAQSVSGVSFGQLTAVVPVTATNAPISVTTASGTATSSQIFYLFPGIISFTPTNSGPGTTVTITGQNLLGATNVSFNGANVAIAPNSNNTTLPVTVPNGVSTGPLGVITPGGAVVSVALFYGAPVINSFSPTHGLPNTNVIIFGTNFLDASSVRFNGSNASFNVVNNGQINAVVPPNASTGPITVTAPAGVATSASPFTLDFLSDLVVTITDAPDPVFVSSNLVYRIVVTNSGPFSAPNVVLTNLLPGSVILKSASTTLGTLNTNLNPVTGALGTLGVSGSATITLVVVPQTQGGLSSTVNAASGYTDPTPANATATATTTVLPLPLLSIQVYSPTQVQISWPAALTTFGLQFNDDLHATNGWSAVLTPPFTIGDQKFVIEPIAPNTRYYRLKQ